MSMLEKTLINSAELELQMLTSLAHDGEPVERANCYQRISALTILAHIKDNGLTPEGVAALERVEVAANELMKLHAK
ncbi:hypothetical protein [Halomonas sp. HAL1]|jgi:hypothetical protein|uniref:hypothetical protein n=1 Tax=Halomonadaceae TaxID=28256 RepID=UPI00022D2770|nr:hypothetical protein [Halomonas sp. HAL1]EHA15276.1 hypothetical protein HAL1_12194 [Halomonas sp. HAL1]WKV95062.1 hypothetical protein Q3Y66_20430 [Halomonas sp. HAL1]